MAMANHRRSRSPPANRQRSCSPPPTASSLFFPPELILEVAKRLTNLQDFFALRAACRAYRALLPLTASNLASQVPLLLIGFDRTRSDALFRHSTLKRIHRFRLPRSALDGNGHVVTQFHPLGCRLAIYERHGGVGALPLRSNLSIVHLLTVITVSLLWSCLKTRIRWSWCFSEAIGIDLFRICTLQSAVMVIF